ncbi:MBG domain-containing protein [Flavobacterium hydatis]|uniref:MBG domain-containing protein n=1 Tax=Flavobacterium hydatis TaxID=991 RepID=UPI0033939FE1
MSIVILGIPFCGIAQNPGGISGEVLWYKANSGVSLVSGNVAVWNDSSTSANNATQITTVNQPAYTTNGINFNQAVTFSGANYLTTPTTNLPSGNSARTVFVVATSTNTQPGNSWVYGYGTASLASAFNIGKVSGSTALYVNGVNDDSESTPGFWSANVPKLGRVMYSVPTVSFFDAGVPIGTAIQTGWNTVVAPNSGRIGSYVNSTSDQWNGNIAEVIIYPSLVTGTPALSVESYLAIKYGIHKTGNYLSGSGTVVWDAVANVLYDNDVFGIGHDNASGLVQTQSNSANTGSGDGTGQSGKGNIIISNPSSLANNGFIMIGHDIGLLAEADITIGGKLTKRVQRIWRAQTTGNPGTVTLSYDITGQTYSGQNANDFVLLVDPTGLGDFVGGSVVKYTGASLAGNKVSFNTVSLPTGAVFTIQTLGVPLVQATNIAFTGTTATSTTASWTNGSGSSRAVFVYAGASGSALPIDLTSYTANAVFGSGTQIGSTGWYCVYNGTGTSVNITGLTPTTTYQVMTLEYSASILGNEVYLSTISTGNPGGITIPNNVGTLSNLSISEGTLAPVFATGTTIYTATVTNSTSSLTLTPTTTDSNATVKVNGVVVTSGTASGAITLVVGLNVITTEVTAEDGITIENYILTVDREPLGASASPTIANFSPQTGPVGTTVIITGANFGATIAENIVFFGATRATVTAATPVSLTVTVPVGAIYQAISVLNTTTVLSGYSSIPFITTFAPNKGRITIDDIMPKVDFATVNFVQATTSGDFDGDGKADIAVTFSSDNLVAIYRNTSVSGTIDASSFTASGTFATGTTPIFIRTGDLDGDGKLDIVVTNTFTGTNTISVLRNTSSGTGNIGFTAHQDFNTGDKPYGVVIGDIDGDGKADIVTSNLNGNSVSVIRNISSGIGNINFNAKVDFSVVNSPYGVTLGDLDGDGKLDMVVTNSSTTETISVFRNISTNGTINFDPKIGFSTGFTATRVQIGDLNKDGKPDIVTGGGGNTFIYILQNTSAAIGSISFAPKIDLPIDAGINDFIIGDLDGDGFPDLAGGMQNSLLNILRNSGSGGTISFVPKVSFINNSFATGVVIDDFDGDGKSDIATVNNNRTLSVFRNNPLFAPTVQATNVVFTATTKTTTTASWTNGNGSSRAVFMNAGIIGSPLPIDVTVYTANAAFGTGTQIGTSGWYCVYNGTGTTVDITGLTLATNYRVMVVEQNGSAGDEMYLSTVSTGNPANVITLNNVATLSNLTISQGTLNPVFASGTTIYTANVANAVTSLTVMPTATDSNATVKVNGVTVTSGSPSFSISLLVGANVINTLVIAQDGTTIETYTVTVTRTALPAIVTTGTLAALTTTYGTASASTTFNVSGTDMLEGILVTAPSGFEISTDDVTFTNTVTVGATGVIASTPVYIRLKKNVPAGSYSGDIILTSDSAITVNVPTVSSTVNKATLTATADNKTKIYGAANPTLTITYSGFFNSETEASLLTPPTIATTAALGSPVGNYPIVASGGVDPNYIFDYVDGNLAVTAATLTVTADNKTKIYGAANPPLTITYSGFANSETEASLLTPPTIATTAALGSPVGNYPIVASGGVDPNYIFDYVDGNLAVTAATLTVTADNKTKIYGAANPPLTITYSGFANSETEASLLTPPTIATTAALGSPVGSYPIVASGGVDPNYIFDYVDGNLAVTAATLTVTADNKTKIYGAANPPLTITYSGFANSETEASLLTSPTITTTADLGSPAGDYPIVASGGVDPNYIFDYVDGNLTITPVEIIVEADNQTKAYGAANPALTVTYSGFVNGDDEGVLTTVATITTTADTTSPVGTYPITAIGAAARSYTFTYVPAILTVTPVEIIVTATNASKVYGAVNPTLTASYTGFVNGDDETILTTQATITTTADTTSPVGTYPITATGAAALNYTFNYVPATLTVTPVEITVTADNQSKVYGAANPTLTASYTGFVNGDDETILTTQATITTTADTTSPVGTYPITATGAAALNYTFNYVPATLTVTPVEITVTADNQSKVYGAANPTLTASYTGFVNGDDETILTTQATITTTADTTSPVGTYPITATGAAALNYTFNYVAATLTVTPVEITVTADNQTKVYGAANPTLTASYAGFVNGDDETILTTQAIITTTADTTSPVGTYPITATGAAALNYTFNYVPATLTVTPVEITVTADNQTKVYGAANPTLTASYAGFVNGDDETILTTQATITTTADTTSPVGTYPITATGAAALNYTFNYVAATLTVTPVEITVTADNQTKVYGATNPTLTASYAGFVNGDDETILTTQATITTTADTTSPVGTYPITATGAAALNYTFNYVPATLTVTPVEITVTADNQTKVYGAVNPTLTVSYAGFVNGDDEAVLTTAATITTTADTTSPVGTYPITATGAAALNYTFNYVPATLTVTPVEITVTADNQTKVYGAVNPTLTASYTGFVNGDDETILTAQAIITTTADTTSPVGTYPITATGAAALNYTFNYVPATLTVTPVEITVTADNQTKVYGAVNPTLTATYAGFINGDDETILTTQATITTTADTTSPVGTYPITATGAAALNYTFNYVPATLTVTPVEITVTAANASKVYGAVNPTLTASYAGFVNGDDETILTTAATITTTADTTSPVGTYPITATGAAALN